MQQLEAFDMWAFCRLQNIPCTRQMTNKTVDYNRQGTFTTHEIT